MFRPPPHARALGNSKAFSAGAAPPGPAQGCGPERRGRARARGRGRGELGGGSSRGLGGRRTHRESLVSARLRRTQRGAGPEVSVLQLGTRVSGPQYGGWKEAVAVRRARGDPSWGGGGGAPSAGVASQVLSGRGAAEVGERRGKRSARERAEWEWTRGTGSSRSPGRAGRARRRQEHGSGAPGVAKAGAEGPPGALHRPTGRLRASPGTHLGVRVHPGLAGISWRYGEEAGLHWNGGLVFAFTLLGSIYFHPNI